MVVTALRKAASWLGGGLSALNPIGWLASFMGPKLLAGIALTATTGLAVLWWAYSAAVADEARAESAAAGARQALEAQQARFQDEMADQKAATAKWKKAAETYRAKADRAQKAARRARKAREAAQEAANKRAQKIARLKEANANVQDWATNPVPGPMRRWLLNLARSGRESRSAAGRPDGQPP